MSFLRGVFKSSFTVHAHFQLLSFTDALRSGGVVGEEAVREVIWGDV